MLLVAALPLGAVGDEAGGSAGQGELQLEVTGLESDAGQVVVALFDSAEAWEKEEPVTSAFLPIQSGRARWVFEKLAYGEYAAKLFHDANGNGKLDTNWVGLPKEAYGFSNDARGRMGPPSYEAARIHFERSGASIRIQVH